MAPWYKQFGRKCVKCVKFKSDVQSLFYPVGRSLLQSQSLLHLHFNFNLFSINLKLNKIDLNTLRCDRKFHTKNYVCVCVCGPYGCLWIVYPFRNIAFTNIYYDLILCLSMSFSFTNKFKVIQSNEMNIYSYICMYVCEGACICSFYPSMVYCISICFYL